MHYHGLEAGVQLREEGRFPRQSQHSLLNHGALHVIILDHHVLLQDFNGVQFVGAFPLSQHHLKGIDKSPGWCFGSLVCELVAKDGAPHLAKAAFS